MQVDNYKRFNKVYNNLKYNCNLTTKAKNLNAYGKEREKCGGNRQNNVL